MGMRIIINGRFLTQPVTGVQRFAEEITAQLSMKIDDLCIAVHDINSVVNKELISRFNIIEVKGGDGHYWEQVTLPVFLKKNGRPLLINLGNTAPSLYKNKIVTHHDVTYIRYPQSYPFSFRLFYRLLTPVMFRNSKKILTVSEFSKKEICNVYGVDSSKIAVVYNAVNPQFTPAEVELVKQKPYILAVSSQNFHKNFHGLVDAFTSTKLNVGLKIIGHKAKAFSDVELNVDDFRVEYIGRVTDCQLVELYRGATAFVFPSLYEGFGIPPLEAQSCGCPVISSDAASMKEVLMNSALFFDPNNRNEIREAIEEIVSNQSIRDDLIERGFINVERFSWEKSASNVLEIIENYIN